MDSEARVPVWEKAFAVAALCLSTAAVFPLLHAAGGVADPTQGDGASEKLWLAVYTVVVVLLLRLRVPLRSVVAANKALVALVGLAVASVAWSDVPFLTLRRSVALALTTLFAVYLATRFTRRELGTLISWALALVVLGSAAMAVLKPSYGLDHVRGDAWRGVFTTKNELGRIAAFALGLWLLRLITLRGHPVVALTLAAAAADVVIRASSRTAAAVALGILVFFSVLPALRAHFGIAIPGGAAFLGFVILATDWLVTRADSVLSSVGSTPTLTGRSEIWRAVWSMIHVHPWLGYGYAAFWRGIEGPSALVWAVVPSRPPHSHNGLLDLWLDLGLVGVTLVVIAFVIGVVRAFREARTTWSFEAAFPLYVLVFLALYNVSETTLLIRNSLFWIVFVVASVQVSAPRATTVGEPATAETPSPRVRALPLPTAGGS